MKRRVNTIAVILLLLALKVPAQKPKVWIFTDMTDKTLPGNNHMGTINDPDDHSAMAGYLLMANMFDTRGIVVGSTNRPAHKTTPNQGDWANVYWKGIYEKEVKNLNETIGGYPKTIDFMESCIKETAEKFNPDSTYKSLENYASVKALLDAAASQSDIMNVLCWGTLTEPAIFAKHCLTNNRSDVLERVRFVAHWTSSSYHMGSVEHPETVPNCAEDAEACAYLKQLALNGAIRYYECGAIGQFGIVSGSPKGDDYYESFKVSALGKRFVEGKYRYGCPDHSDAATYWVLLQNWGVSFNDINSNGTNYPEVEKANEEKFKFWSERIHNELLRRAQAASGQRVTVPTLR